MASAAQPNQPDPEPRRLTDAEKALCSRARELEPVLSYGWQGFRNFEEGRTEILVEGDNGADARPILILTEEISYADREMVVRGAQMVRALVAGGRYLKWANEQLRAEIRSLKGQPDPKAKKPFSHAQNCAIQCAKPDFKHWLHEIHGADISDQIRVDNHVRSMLQIGSRAELDHDPEAARRWLDLYGSFKRRAR
ncbi:hypothetical protein DMY87_18260 [Rhizobium wuzhouense]|uniref:Uncharacterized protein n=2 Tax=Rhizobium wuzhouense TaxID=1986026 RepID=A0ABX5NPK8_9HYPH|nr:hypothetical protein DMY87_18260 [Rhizobium wuzhouense]